MLRFYWHEMVVSSLEFAAILDHDLLSGPSALGPNLFDSVNNFESFHDLSEDTMLSVQPWGIHGTNED